ncbi:MAG: hypothetical protein IPI87_10835 [Betaproteobacteria bacterium]|nr:hypothetical protein [Betaproteobacteria bacterium]
MRHEAAPGRPRDGIEVDQGLEGQEGETQHHQRGLPARDASRGGEVLSKRDLVRLAQQFDGESAGGRKRQDRDHQKRPQPGVRKHRPSQKQQQREAGRDEASPQVVEELPLRERRQGIGRAARAGSRH